MKKSLIIFSFLVFAYLIIGFVVFTVFTGSRVRDYPAIQVNGTNSSTAKILFVWPYYVLNYLNELRNESPDEKAARISCKEGEGYWQTSCVSFTANECKLDSSPFAFLEFGCNSKPGSLSYICKCPLGTCWSGEKCISNSD